MMKHIHLLRDQGDATIALRRVTASNEISVPSECIENSPFEVGDPLTVDLDDARARVVPTDNASRHLHGHRDADRYSGLLTLRDDEAARLRAEMAVDDVVTIVASSTGFTVRPPTDDELDWLDEKSARYATPSNKETIVNALGFDPNLSKSAYRRIFATDGKIAAVRDERNDDRARAFIAAPQLLVALAELPVDAAIGATRVADNRYRLHADVDPDGIYANISTRVSASSLQLELDHDIESSSSSSSGDVADAVADGGTISWLYVFDLTEDILTVEATPHDNPRDALAARET